MSIGIFFHANVNPTAKLASSTVVPVIANETASMTSPPTKNAPATIRSFVKRSSRAPTVRIPRSTPIPPAPIRLENEPTPSPNRSRNTTSESVSTRPWPSWSSEIDVIGPMALGVRKRRSIPSTNSAPTRRSS